MSNFKRGLDDEFIEALQKEAEKGGWWRDVLADPSLVLAIRDAYLNVYWLGQSIFKIRFAQNSLAVSTHAKYLLNPSLSKQVKFDGDKFYLGDLEASALVRDYVSSGETLGKLKKAAAVYANGEKIGVHSIVTSNPSVVDVEIALSAAGYEGVGKLPRMDIAAFERAEHAARLVFWEAKLFENNELRANNGDAAVVGQIAKYRSMIAAHKKSLLSSYTRVAANLSSLADMSLGARSVPDFVREVGRGSRTLTLSDPADIGLIIFGFDQAQRDHAPWQKHLGGLRAVVGDRIRTSGSPKGINI